MANEATLALVLKLNDQASAGMDQVSRKMVLNRQAVRDLAQGFTFLGSSLLGVGVALSQSNNEFSKNVGQMAIFVGGLLSAVGSSIQFIFQMQRMIKVLKELAIAQTILQAFSGPKGWATLGIGLAVAGGAVYGINQFTKTTGQAERRTGQTTIINNNVQSVITERDLNEMSRSYVIRKGDQNGNTGVRP